MPIGNPERSIPGPSKPAPPAPPLPHGTGRCRCAAYGRSFGGVGGFDAHQRPDGAGAVVCLDPAGPGMVERGGWWGRGVPWIVNGVGRDGANGADADHASDHDTEVT